MNWIFILKLSWARAQIIPSYADELEERALEQITQHIQTSEYGEAHEFLEEYFNKIDKSETLLYDTALLFNQAGYIEGALSVYTQLLEINSAHRAALYDRSELLLERGQFDEARIDLLRASEIEEHWILYLRLAEIAATNMDVFTCEQNLMRAFASGMDPQELLKFGEKWYNWSKHPHLGLVIKHTLILDAGLGGEQTWKRLQQPLQ